MKTIIAAFFLFSGSIITAYGQVKTSTQTKPATPSPPPPVAIKTLDDSVSYAIGISVASFYKQQGVDKLNAGIMAQAVSDVMNGKKVLLDDMQASNVIMNFMNKKEMDKSRPNIEAGEKFLAENKKRPGVMTTPSGLQYEVVKLGDGPKPALTDNVQCNYKGSFLDGNVFENSFDGNGPVSFQVGGVIKGWTEGLQLMPVGSRFIFYIPHQLGYGPGDYGAIPGGSTLIFEIELIGIKAK